MTNFWRRLKYYGFGFLLGLLFLVFFFQNRGCSWLPGNRVKNAVLDRLIVVTEETQEQFDRKGITKEEIINVLNDGEVDFGKSNKDNEDKVYVINKDGINFLFTLPHESFVSEVKLGSKVKGVKTADQGLASIIHFPKDDNLIYPDSTNLVTCQQEKLGLIAPKEILKMIKKTGKLDLERSDLDRRPKPEQFIWFKTPKGERIGIQTIWYKNKINIIRFEDESGSVKCD